MTDQNIVQTTAPDQLRNRHFFLAGGAGRDAHNASAITLGSATMEHSVRAVGGIHLSGAGEP
jgi:hypothetical protein